MRTFVFFPSLYILCLGIKPQIESDIKWFMEEAHWRVGQRKCHPLENLISILSESANEAVACTGSLSQGDHVLNRLPLLKYSWAEIYSLIFHYLLSLYFAYIRSSELLLVTITFVSHSPAWCHSQFAADYIAYMQQIMRRLGIWLSYFSVAFSSVSEVWVFFFLSLCDQSGRDSEFSGFVAQKLKWGDGGWSDDTPPGLLKLNRISTSAQMFVSYRGHTLTCQYGCRCTNKYEQTGGGGRRRRAQILYLRKT